MSEVMLNDVESLSDTITLKSRKQREKILVFNTSFFDVSQTFIWQQVNILSGRYDIHLVGMSFMNPHNYDMDSWSKYRVARAPGLVNKVLNKAFGLNLFNFRSYVLLFRLLRKNKFKAVHTHFGTLALLILPVVRFFKIPLVVTFHGADASRMVRHKSYMRRLPALFNYASAIIIVSRHMKETLKLDRWEKKVHVVPCTVDPEQLDSLEPVKDGNELFRGNGNSTANGSGQLAANGNQRELAGNGNRALRIVHTGRLTPKKGVPDLISVFGNLTERYPDAELHIIGDGEELEKCKVLVEENHYENNVFFYGAVPHEDNMMMLKNADIFVLNSRTAEDGDMEGTPVTLLEAMGMGKAVVSTQHAGIPDVIRDGYNGLLVQEKDNAALQTALEKLINDRNLCSTLAENAKKTILESYTTKDLEKKLTDVFSSI